MQLTSDTGFHPQLCDNTDYFAYFSPSGGELHIQEKPISVLRFNPLCAVYLEVADNKLGRLQILSADCDIHVMVDNPWTQVNCHNQAFDYFFNGSTAKLHLHGHDVFLPRLILNGTVGAAIDTDAEATLSFAAKVSDTLPRYGKNETISGPLNLRLTAESLESTPYVCETRITSTGGLIVEGGVFEFRAGSSWTDIAFIRLNGGKVRIPEGMTLTVPALYFGEETDSQDERTYSAENCDAILGAGSIKVDFGRAKPVETVELTWTAGAGADDTEIWNLDNWKNAVSVPADGSLLATFAEQGSRATAQICFPIRGIVFDAPNDFTVCTEETLRIGDGGLSVCEPTDGTRVYAFESPIELTSEQTWRVDSAAATLAVKSTVLSPDTGAGICKTGPGTVQLGGTNDFTSALVISNGVVSTVSSSNALGRAGGAVTIWQQHGGALVLNGGVEEKTIKFMANNTASSATSGLYVSDNARVTLLGAIEQDGTGRIAIGAGAELTCAGGFSSWYTAVGGSGTLNIVDKPCQVALSIGNNVVNIRSAGGTPGRAELFGGELHCWVENAYASDTTMLSIGSPNGFVNLHGNSQTFGHLSPAEYAYNGNGYVTSGEEGPCTLRLNQRQKVNDLRADCTNTVCNFRGCLTIEKKGAYGILQAVSCPSAGDIVVTEGKFGFIGGGDWLNGTNVTVSGTGVLEVNKSETFGEQAVWTLADSGRVVLGEDVVQKCARLYFSSGVAAPVLQAGGTWGATGSGAKHVDDVHFAGKGVLKVRGPVPLTLLIK